MKVTVAICTWNRAELLDKTLERMHALRIPDGVDWELIVVDNNSPDDTGAVIDRHAGKLPTRKLFEGQQGKSYALNTAVAAATGDLIIWTDDDVLVDENWLAAYVEAAQAWPGMTYFGGRILPWFQGEPPQWVVRHLDRIGPAFALLDLDEGVRPLAPHELPYGASLAIRGDVQRRYLYDVSLGHSKHKNAGGEEIDLVRRLLADGHTGLWVGTSVVRHYMHPQRLTPGFVRGWFQKVSMSETLRQPSDASRPWLGVPRWALKAYCIEWLKEMASARRQDNRWIDAFTRRAQLHGMIRAARARHRTA